MHVRYSALLQFLRLKHADRKCAPFRSFLQFQNYLASADGRWILDHLAVALARGMETPYNTLVARADFAAIFELPEVPVAPAVIVEAPASSPSKHPNMSERT